MNVYIIVTVIVYIIVTHILFAVFYIRSVKRNFKYLDIIEDSVLSRKELEEICDLLRTNIYDLRHKLDQYREEIERYRGVELNQNYDDLRVRYNYLKSACKDLQRQIRNSFVGRGECPQVIIKGPITTDVIEGE